MTRFADSLEYLRLAESVGLYEWADLENTVNPLPEPYVQALLEFARAVAALERDKMSLDAKRWRWFKHANYLEMDAAVDAAIATAEWGTSDDLHH